MKLDGIILPTSVAESSPTIVPAGAFCATVKLVIVIVMNLSGLERSPPLENQPVFPSEASCDNLTFVYIVRDNLSIRNKLAKWVLTRNRRRIIMAGRLDLGESGLRHRYLMYFMRKIDVLLRSVIDRIERTAMARRSHGAQRL